MALFKIEVREVLSRNVIIEAENLYEAFCKTEEAYKREEIVLDADDLITQDIFLADSLMSRVLLPDEMVEHLNLLLDYFESNEQKGNISSHYSKQHIGRSVAALRSVVEIYK